MNRLIRLMLAKLVVALILGSFLSSGSASASETFSWSVGLARKEITPKEPIWLAGYASRNKPSEGVLTPLYADAMAIADNQGQRGLIITADVIGFRKDVADATARAVMEKTGLLREQILFNWSHTHTGPVIGFLGSTGYSMGEEEQKVVDAYTRWLVAQYADLAVEALNDLKPARIAWGLGVTNIPVNRREFTETGVRLGVNPRGYADRGVPVLTVRNEQNQLRAVLFGCACHNTTLTEQHYMISGDYAGYARAYIENKLPGVQALFLIGCGGDANPYPRGEIEHAQRHGEALGAEVCRVVAGQLREVSGPLKTTLAEVDLPLLPPPDREQLEKMATGPSYVSVMAKRMLEIVDRGESLPTHYQAPIGLWQFGNDLTLVAIPGEVVSDYVPLIEHEIGHLRLWVAGYCNEVFGYLPSAKVIREGGYETRGLFDLPGLFSPEVEKVVAETVKKLAEQAGRPQLP
ncbi:MAG: neutral/alkaline non-lysosomal ceramidase N-terminal domain-containing protein [Thermogutta sp.]